MDSISIQVIVAFVFGVTFVIALILLAIKFEHPTPFQYNVFRTILSLAAAGTAAMIPGFIDLQVSTTTKLLIRAGGALAVFVITFFFNPAQLASRNANENAVAEGPPSLVPPDLPERLRDGIPFPPDERMAFFRVWECLVQLDRAGQELWNEISDSTLSNFSDRRHAAEHCIAEHALFFPEDVYAALQKMIRAADFYLSGKVTLSAIRSGQVISDEMIMLAGPGQRDRFVDNEVRHQIEQNKRWLSRYRKLLKDIRWSFHHKVRLSEIRPLGERDG